MGEGDRTSGIEDVYGGTGDDRLIGDGRGNLLDGFDGADVLIGRGGSDDLRGGRGRDRLRGGRGPDRVAGGAGIDSLSCGGGSDLVDPEGPRVPEVVSRHCERMVLEVNGMGIVVSPHLRRTQPWWRSLRIECPWSDDYYYACRGTVTVRENQATHRLLAHGSFSHSAADGASFAAPVALTRLGWLWQTGRLGSAAASVSLRMIAKYTPRRPFRWMVATARG